MASKFSERQTEVPYIVEVELRDSGASYSRARFASSGLRHASPMIRVDGRLALAECVMKNIVGRGFHSRSRWPGVRFGPGGRRRFCWVTEELIEDILKACNWGGPNWRKNSREEKRNSQVADFALDLLEEIS